MVIWMIFTMTIVKLLNKHKTADIMINKPRILDTIWCNLVKVAQNGQDITSQHWNFVVVTIKTINDGDMFILIVIWWLPKFLHLT